MSLDEDIEKVFKKVATSLKLGYKKTTAAGVGKVYNFFKDDKFLVRFTTFIDTREKITILVNYGSMTQPPLSWGSYKRDEFDKATKTVMVKTTDLINSKKY